MGYKEIWGVGCFLEQMTLEQKYEAVEGVNYVMTQEDIPDRRKQVGRARRLAILEVSVTVIYFGEINKR